FVSEPHAALVVRAWLLVQLERRSHCCLAPRPFESRNLQAGELQGWRTRRDIDRSLWVAGVGEGLFRARFGWRFGVLLVGVLLAADHLAPEAACSLPV